ncbi:PO113 protein, partial [Struthidea cinerea]|nr:PO113 protein [Struthidea cinerea]
GFEIQKDKVQLTQPWKYLGLTHSDRTITPQKVAINNNPRTLQELHQLCGSINWIRPLLGLTTEDLAPLFNLLKGDDDLTSPRTLTEEAKESIKKVQDALNNKQAHRYCPSLPFKFIVLGQMPHLYGLIFQDPLLIIEWVFLSHQPSKSITMPQENMVKLVIKARSRLCTLAGCDFECIYLPLTLESTEYLLQVNEALQFTLDSFTGQISIHPPKHKLFNTIFKIVPKPKQSQKPLKALTVFTDASGASHKSVITWKNPQTNMWERDIETVAGSPQVAELPAVVRAFERFSEPFNLVTDSAYVAGVVSRAEYATLKEVRNPDLYQLLSKLIRLLSHREQPYYVMHTRSHTNLPGFIAEGNHRADQLALPIGKANLPNLFEQAKISHAMFHQNSPALRRNFHLTREQARAIVATCPNCQTEQGPACGIGVNPRGLGANELWQTDITHIASFGRTKYVHVSVDTFSGTMFASAHAGEKAKDAMNHLVMAFSAMGIPGKIKTDNGPAYASSQFRTFLQDWGIQHSTGIPHSPTGQSVVERAHQTLK